MSTVLYKFCAIDKVIDSYGNVYQLGVLRKIKWAVILFVLEYANGIPMFVYIYRKREGFDLWLLPSTLK